jgi:hypothetical protein
MLPVKCEVLGIKVETTQNTPATLAATDFMLAQDVSVKPVPEYLPREYRRASLDKLASLVGKIYVDVNFKMELKGSGTAGTAYAPLSNALQASGFAETIVAVTSVTYAPISAPASTSFFTIGKSCTVEYYEGSTTTRTGLKHIVKGCVASGGPKLVLEAGKIPMVEFTFRGLYVAVTDAVAPSATYSAILPSIVQSANFSFHGFSAIISKLEIDGGGVIAERLDVSSVYGLKGFALVDRDPKGSIDPESDLVANFDFYGKMASAANDSMSVVVGATAGNIMTITTPKAQFAGLDPADRNSMRTFQLPLKFNQSTGDDWISIAFT